jgi:hypothetical protein
LAGFHGAVWVTYQTQILCHVRADPPQPLPLVNGLSDRLSFAKIVEDPRVFSEQMERIAKIESDIDGFFAAVATQWEVFKGHQCLLEVRGCLSVG